MPDKINQRKKGNMFELHKTSAPTRLKNQNLILSILSPPIFHTCHHLLSFHFSVFRYFVPNKTNFHHVLRCPSNESRVLYVWVSRIAAWALHAGVSLFLSLSLLPFLFLPFFPLAPYSSPLCFSARGMLVLLSVVHVFPVSLFLSVQGMCCSRWRRSTDRSITFDWLWWQH